MTSVEDFMQRRPYNAVADFVDANVARGLGHKRAFGDGTRTLTYGELQTATVRCANALRVHARLPQQVCKRRVGVAGPFLSDRLLLFLEVVLEPVAFAFAEAAVVEREGMNADATQLTADGIPCLAIAVAHVEEQDTGSWL